MALETGTRIADLVATNPLASDPAGQGDDHLRLIKACVQGSLPNIGAIFGQARQIDTATSLSSTWNTNHIFCSGSATATVVLTLPPGTSITSGFYFDITALSAVAVSVLPSGAGIINGAASLSIPERSTAHVFHLGGGLWRANVMPTGLGGVGVFDNLQVTGTLSVSGATSLGGTLGVSGATTFNGPVSAVSTVIFNSIFRVTGTTLLNTMSASGAVSLLSTLSVSAATTLGSTLSVSGNATLLGGLDVKGGTASFSTAVYMGSTLSVSGAAHMATTLSVGGAATFASTLSVSGAAHMNTTLSVGGATTLGSTLTVSGATVMQGAATVGGTLSVSGGAHLNTTLSVGGAATLGSTLSVSGATVLAGTVAVRGAATLDTTLSVSGAATFKSASSFAASVVIGTTLNVAGATTLSGAATMKGIVSIGGAATLGSTLTVSGTAVFVGLLQLGGNLNLNNGNINFPAVQNPSAGANTLDDYEEGTWTPFIDYVTTGNLNVVFSTQTGTYTKVGRLVTLTFVLVTSTFTHTTASGSMLVSGVPFTASSPAVGATSYEGLSIATGVNYDGPVLRINTGGTVFTLVKSGINNNGRVTIDHNSHVSGTNVSFDGTTSYEAS